MGSKVRGGAFGRIGEIAGRALGGLWKQILELHAVVGGVGVGVVEGVERPVGRHGDLENLVCLVVDDLHDDGSAARAPVERDLDPVGNALSQLPAVILVCACL